MDATGLEEEQKSEIHDLIINRNYFGVEEILDNQDAADNIKAAFQVLSELMAV